MFLPDLYWSWPTYDYYIIISIAEKVADISVLSSVKSLTLKLYINEKLLLLTNSEEAYY